MEFLYSLSFPISITNISIGAHTMVICSRLITKVNTLRLSRCWNGWSCKRPNQASQMTIMGAYQKRSPQEVRGFPYFTVQIEALITGIAINWPNRIRFWKKQERFERLSQISQLFMLVVYCNTLYRYPPSVGDVRRLLGAAVLLRAAPGVTHFKNNPCCKEARCCTILILIQKKGWYELYSLMQKFPFKETFYTNITGLSSIVQSIKEVY